MTAEDVLPLVTAEDKPYKYPEPENWVWDEPPSEEEMEYELVEARNEWAHEVAQRVLARLGIDPDGWDDYLQLVVYLESGEAED
jgi:hypothetical protein